MAKAEQSEAALEISWVRMRSLTSSPSRYTLSSAKSTCHQRSILFFSQNKRNGFLGREKQSSQTKACLLFSNRETLIINKEYLNSSYDIFSCENLCVHTRPLHFVSLKRVRSEVYHSRKCLLCIESLRFYSLFANLNFRFYSFFYLQVLFFVASFSCGSLSMRQSHSAAFSAETCPLKLT